MADTSGFRTSEFIELSMTYHKHGLGFPSGDITHFSLSLIETVLLNTSNIFC